MLAKLKALEDLIGTLGSVGVAYSGGTDSSFLLKVARDVLGDAVVGFIADSRSLPRSELDTALDLADRIGARVVRVPVDELAVEGFATNPVDRCYHCKRYILERILEAARSEGLARVIDGVNAEDLSSHGHGTRAARELGVRSPLAEVGLGKQEIRSLSRSLGLPTADKPHSACLATRIPYGQRITAEKLEQVERAEGMMRQLGVGQLRLRHHGDVARIEVLPEEFGLVIRNRDRIVAGLKELGFRFVCLDLEGFRSGSLEPEDRSERS